MNLSPPRQYRYRWWPWGLSCTCSCLSHHRRSKSPLPLPSSCALPSCQELLPPAGYPASVPYNQPSHSIRPQSSTCRKSSRSVFGNPRSAPGMQVETPLPAVGAREPSASLHPQLPSAYAVVPHALLCLRSALCSTCHWPPEIACSTRVAQNKGRRAVVAPSFALQTTANGSHKVRPP